MDLFYCSCIMKYCYVHNALQRKTIFFFKVRAPYKNKYTQQWKSTKNMYCRKASRDSDNEVG